MASLSRNLSARANVISTTTSNPAAYAVLSFRVSLDPRSINFYATPFSPYSFAKDEPDNKELHAYAKIGWFDDGVAEHPLYPFYEGASEFRVSGYKEAAQIRSINFQPYKWSVTPQIFLPQTAVPRYGFPTSSYWLDELTVEPSTRTKNFHWNMGNDASALPKDTVASVVATDPSDGAKFSGTALIHWHWAFEGGGGGSDDDTITKLPGGLIDTLVPGTYGGTPSVVQKPIQNVNVGDKIRVAGKELNRRVTNKTTNPDGSITLTLDIDPDDNPTDDFYDTNKQILRIQDAKTQQIRRGATYVGYGLQGYVELAGMTVGAPLYNLGTDALLAMGGKAVSLIGKAQKARDVAAKLGQVLGGAQSVLVKLRTKLGTLASGTDEFAQVTSKIDEMEEVARKAKAGADEAADAAAKMDDYGKFVKEGVDAQLNDIAAAPEAQLLALPQGGTASVAKNELSDAEFAVAQKASQLRGLHFEGQPIFNQPGIDGWIDGVPACIQEATGSGASNVRNALGKARGDVWNAHKKGVGTYKLVEVFIDAPNCTSQELVAYARTQAGKSLRTLPGLDTIGRVTVFCSDSVVYFWP